MTVRVLVATRVFLYSEGLRRLLEEDPGLRVTTLPFDAEDVTDHAATVDLVICDAVSFSDWAGLGPKILLIWDPPQPLPAIGDLKAMVQKGLGGIVDASLEPALLRKAVQRVHSGELWLDHRTIQNSLCTFSDAGPGAPLSRRESDVLQQIRDGHTNKEIADRLCISEQTVKTHCRNLFKKFGVSSRLQLAVRTGTMPASPHPQESP